MASFSWLLLEADAALDLQHFFVPLVAVIFELKE
jgi:hypothetical protein